MAEIKFVRMQITDPEKLKEACNKYFAFIESQPPRMVPHGRQVIQRRVPPTMAGLARVLGISTWTLAKYLRGEVTFPEGVSEETQDELLRILTAARTRIEDIIVTGGMTGELDNTVVRQHMSLFGYGHALDESGEEANNTVRVVITGASQEEAARWAK